MICAPALGMLVAIALDRLLVAHPARTRYVGLLGVALALLPLVPTPLRAVERTDVPAFIDLLRNARNSGDVPPVNASGREQARADLAYWRSGVLVFAPQPNDGALRETVEKLIARPGRWVNGVWVWDLHERGLG